MTDEELKQACKDWALASEKKTGNFPVYTAWYKILHPDDPPPCGRTKLRKIFSNYNHFREFCGKNMQNVRFKTLKKKFEYYLSHKTITDNGCWITSLTDYDYSGYGRIGFTTSGANRHTMYTLHILSYLYHRDGYVTPKSYKNRAVDVVRHTCATEKGENRGCFNPNHLAPGDKSSNLKDSFSYHAGVKVYGKIYDILTEHDENRVTGMGIQESYRAIASKYNMTADGIGAIIRGKKWKDDPGRIRYESERNIMSEEI